MTRAEYIRAAIPVCHGYQELHTHSEASFRDAVCKVEEIVDAAKKLGRQAFSITDHGNQMRLFHGIKARAEDEKRCLKAEMKSAGISDDEQAKILKSIGPTDSIRYPTEAMWPYVVAHTDVFLRAAQKSIQYVPGIEIYFQPEKDLTKRESYHLILFAKDWLGQKILFRIENMAQLNKSPKGLWRGQETGGLPRTTWEDLERFVGPGSEGHGHIIATSACVGGYIPATLLQPWLYAEQRNEIVSEMGQYKVTDQEVELVKADLESAQNQLKEAKEKARQLKKVEKISYPTKLLRLEKKLAKLMKELDGYQDGFSQISLFGDADDGSQEREKLSQEIESVKQSIQDLHTEHELANTLLPQADEIRETVKKLSDLVDALKQRYANVEKESRPYLNLLRKLNALEEKKVDQATAYQNAVAAAKRMEQIFGHENFFIELQNHGISSEQYVFPLLCQLIQETGIEPTVANDVHYPRKEDVRKRNLIASFRFNTPIEEKENAEGANELYFKSNVEMEALGNGNEIWKRGMENTNRIVSSCNVYYIFGMHLPQFDAHAVGYNSPLEYLNSFCRKMIPEKYPQGDMSDEEYVALLNKVDAKLKYELSVIEKMGYSSYIAIVQDFIFYGRKIGGEVGIGPGRGSAAGSVVCYLADITDIDPIRFDLIFERFLNPARVSMPDIDTDIAPSIRDKIIDYVANKYAYKEEYPVQELSGTVCNIVTEGKLAARLSIRNAARVTGISYALADRVAKLVPSKPGITLQKALDDVPELEEIYENDADAKRLINDAMLVEGIPIQTGIHAAGVIIADKPVSEYAPLFWNEDKHCWVIQCDMVECEKTLGCLKMDFLGLETLDILKTAIQYIKRTHHIQIHLKDLKRADDAAVIESIYGKAQTNAVFQFESEGIKQALLQFAPRSIDDVILMNAAYRPGPMDSIPEITEVKFGKAQPDYIVPEMESILGKTYGSPIYQEQIMQLFQLVGFSLGEADIIRRAMSKKHLNEIEAAKDQFVSGMIRMGGKPEAVEAFWQRLLKFASYAFNKSHAAAYSIVSYYTAWLKYYYPVELLAAQMSSAPDNIKLYAADCKQLGIKITQPDINYCVPNFAPAPGAERSIRYGIRAIKGVAAAADTIFNLRDMREHVVSAHHLGQCFSFKDFVIRSVVFGIDSGAGQALIRSGALDCLFAEGDTRHLYDTNLSVATDSCRKFLKKYRTSLPDQNYDLDSDYRYVLNHWELPDECFANKRVVQEYDSEEKLENEMKYLGIYVSGSPVDAYLGVISSMKNRDRSISDINNQTKGTFDIAGRIRDVKVVHRKSDNAPMAKFVLEDETGYISCIAFTTAYRENKASIFNGAIVTVTGNAKIDTDDDGNVSGIEFTCKSLNLLVQKSK